MKRKSLANVNEFADDFVVVVVSAEGYRMIIWVMLQNLIEFQLKLSGPMFCFICWILISTFC